MRQILLVSLICLSLTLPAPARSGSHGGGGGHGGSSGGFRGSGSRGGGFHSGGVQGGGFTHRTGVRTGFGFQRFPRVYPFFYGGYGYYDPYWYSSPDAYSYSDNNADYGYPAQSAPPFIVNQEFETGPPPAPVIREYIAPGPPVSAPAQRKYDTPLYLVAFHDGEIRAVLAYWVDGASLHYVTMEHAQKQIALASVDRALSERLNGERNVTFQLPR